ncbi:RsbR, positive regulator of sigma-B [Enhygromyxa salina]|uniref:RsbR, positive regulator of sigma-B n=1 Tax=Enhygromyxa salina TaxID=215803 RepID=A0A0C2D4H5_9BACT|nr:STAS domain-containing protein [Enhygromyxa salina]KIG16585.1 RsbR, positive regulator of sigma-B [Enhygromyxa salina]
MDDEFLEMEVGINFLLEELLVRRKENEAQREEIIAGAKQIAAQSAALVAALSTPIIVVWPGVLALPLIGPIDSERASHISATLLARVTAERATHVILDLTGVDRVETQTLTALLRMIRSLRLIGAACFVTGISARGARQIVELGVEAAHFRSLSRVSDALALVLAEKTVKRGDTRHFTAPP